MKKINIIKIIGLGIVILLSTWIIFFSSSSQFSRSGSAMVLQKNIAQETSKGNIFMVIDNGQKAVQSFSYEFQQGLTAFDLLKKSTEDAGLILETMDYDIGVFIKAIGDKQNGQNGQYWMYYVNQEMPMIAADKYELKLGDKVEFKFEKSSF